jgi:hypothetical protein
MTAAANTLYSVTLFLALSVLNLWTDRRQRIPRTVHPCTIHTVAHAVLVSGQ